MPIFTINYPFKIFILASKGATARKICRKNARNPPQGQQPLRLSTGLLPADPKMPFKNNRAR
jgi:hypothetical protein